MKTDILFVHPNASKVIYQDLAKKNSAIEPPIWAGMLANSVRRNGFSPEILDAEVLGLNYENCAKVALEFKARVICFVVYGQQPSASSQNMEGAVATAELIKEISPQTNLLFSLADMLQLYLKRPWKRSLVLMLFVKMKGVYTLRDLLQLTKFEDIELSKINGLCFRDKEGNIRTNKPVQ